MCAVCIYVCRYVDMYIVHAAHPIHSIYYAIEYVSYKKHRYLMPIEYILVGI